MLAVLVVSGCAYKKITQQKAPLVLGKLNLVTTSTIDGISYDEKKPLTVDEFVFYQTMLIEYLTQHHITESFNNECGLFHGRHSYWKMKIVIAQTVGETWLKSFAVDQDGNFQTESEDKNGNIEKHCYASEEIQDIYRKFNKIFTTSTFK